MDFILHVIACAAVYCALHVQGFSHSECSIVIVLAMYIREWTQASIKKYDGINYKYDARKGWNPFRWSKGKNIETWIPPIIVIIIGAFLP